MKNYKALSIVLAVALVMVCAIGGTLAWLTAQTGEVKNTFTSAELFDSKDMTAGITLWEHEVNANSDGTYSLGTDKADGGNSYEVLPGVDLPKDPTVDVVNLEEYAYLYIKVSGTLPEGMVYSIDSSNWTALTGYEDDGVYVYCGNQANSNTYVIEATEEFKKTVSANIMTQTDGYGILVADNYSSTSDDISLTFTAYLVQATGNGENAGEAWKNSGFNTN